MYRYKEQADGCQRGGVHRNTENNLKIKIKNFFRVGKRTLPQGKMVLSCTSLL